MRPIEEAILQAAVEMAIAQADEGDGTELVDAMTTILLRERREALEAAAMICVDDGIANGGNFDASKCAELIRELKP